MPSLFVRAGEVLSVAGVAGVAVLLKRNRAAELPERFLCSLERRFYFTLPSSYLFSLHLEVVAADHSIPSNPPTIIINQRVIPSSAVGTMAALQKVASGSGTWGIMV